ncbi:U32 family peptidase [Aliikangiella sp. IMCC44359]|uniref:U32 family peptidase n=1 Tax=Aliikangiella sp. IMCC44359 TaxID=3459125 RepID=UPI00403B0913
MKISIGTVPYFWTKQKYYEFYSTLAKTNADVVYLGETVCSKRRNMKMQDWLEMAQLLQSTGKQVVLSTMTLIEAESELKYLCQIAKQKDYLIEANDIAAIHVASENNNPFVVGGAINVYNYQTFAKMLQLGMIRWSVPVELGQTDLKSIVEKISHFEVEYQIFGRMSLAYSARCFTARHYYLTKDQCTFKCLDHEQGILVKTQEGESFSQINGIQIQSAKVTNLLSQWQALFKAGVNVFKIVPTNIEDTIKAVNWLDQSRLDNDTVKPINFSGYEFCNGYWFQIEGMQYLSE